MPQERIFTTDAIPGYGFQIQHNLTEPEFKAISRKWELTSPTHSQISILHLINHYTDKGWRAFNPTDSYWGIPAYSNSRLGSIRNQLLSRTELPSRSVFVFGTAFHELLLQPEIISDARDYYLSNSKLETLYRMCKAAQQDETIQAIQAHAQIETTVQWTDTDTGLLCKAKLDAIVTQDGNGNGGNSGNNRRGTKIIFDLKTTACNTEEDFLTACDRYDYWRQMAFYLDGISAIGIVLIGIQKQKPHNLFFVTAHSSDQRIITARARYKFILQKALEMGIQP